MSLPVSERIFEKASVKLDLDVELVRKVFRSVISEGINQILQGDEWFLVGVGSFYIGSEDGEYTLKFNPWKPILSRIEKEFVENRDTTI